MNARARLVDNWRKIDHSANRLNAGISLNLAGTMGTFGANHPANFDARTRTVEAGLQFDTPLNRLAERNDYREAQIEYQRARRDYMLFEDKISQSLRNTLRLTRLSELNFELLAGGCPSCNRSSRPRCSLRLDEPPKPGAVPQFGSYNRSRSRFRVEGLLDAQNDFLSLRVGYDVLRLVLDFELGTMDLDHDGLWKIPAQ